MEQLIGLGFGNVEIGPVANQEHRTTDDVVIFCEPKDFRFSKLILLQFGI